MKKNISINIGGIIFHIEEDGYDKLQAYLSEINTYFKKYEDYTEIINDLEGRIAEIFSGKMDKEKQIITVSDIESLIKTMGTVSDFEFIEDDSEDFKTESQPISEEKSETKGPKKFTRDLQRKVIGGVCSGLAHYYNIDTLWTRVLFLVMFFGFMVIPPASGLAVILYLALWIAFPGDNTIEENKKVKKLYRNPDDKVISGVSSGLAAYFNVDVAIVRLVFVLSVLFFGSGLIIYLALWFITPQAKSMTEKIQMKGDPVTLSNIESSVKRNLQGDENKEENIVVSILLFPFRLIGKIFEVLGKTIGPLLEVFGKVLRILFGLFLIIFSFFTFLGLLILLGGILGIYVSPEFWLDGIQIEVFASILPSYSAIAGVLTLAIPSLALGLLGLRLLTLKSVTNASVAWSLFGVWVISLILSLTSIPVVIKNFAESNEFIEEESYEFDQRTIVLDLNELGSESYNAVKLTIRAHDGSDIKIVKEFQSQGKNRLDALENAKMVSYSIDVQDSVFKFDSNIEFKENATFRAQELEIKMYMPLNQKFIMTNDLEHILYRTISHYDYSVYDLGDNVFVFENLDDLSCLTCENTSEPKRSDMGQYDNSKSLDISAGLNKINIEGAFIIDLSKGDEYRLELKGRKSILDDIKLNYESNELLTISSNKNDENVILKGRKPVYIKLVIPNFNELNISGYNDIKGSELNYENLDIHLEGLNEADLEGNFGTLNLDVEGISEVNLEGEANEFNVSLKGKADLNAENFKAKTAEVEAYGNSNAEITVTGYINAKAAGFSEIQYYGSPRADENVDGFSKIRRR